MVWFRYLSNKEVLGTTTPNENYSYPLLKRVIPKFTPKDTVPDKTWLFVDVTDLNIDKYYDSDLQLQTDDASYIVVYEDPFTDDYFLPVKTVIHEDILYFETAEEHPAGVEIEKQYAVYYKTKGLRKIVEIDNGGRKDYQIYDLPIWIDKELPVISQNNPYSDAVYAYSDPAVTYTISNGRLPEGITLDSVTGSVTGITTYIGRYFFTIRATSTHGYIEADFSGDIGTGPGTPSGPMPNFYFGKNYSYSFAVQSSSPIKYFISSGALPDGVVLDEDTGLATGIVNLNTSTYSNVAYSFTVAFQNQFSTTYKTYTGYVYHSPVFRDTVLSQSYPDVSYSDSIIASGYPNVIYSIEKYNLTSNGIYTDQNYNIYYDPNLSAGLLEFNFNSKGEYLNTAYPQIMDTVKNIEPDNSGGFYIAGNFTAYNEAKLATSQIKKILYINSLNQISSWSLKKNSLDYYGLVSPSFMKIVGSNIYIFTENSGFYENSANQVINNKLGIVSRTTGEILDLNLHTRNQQNFEDNYGYITAATVIGDNIYIGGRFSSVNLPPSSTMLFDYTTNTSVPNYPISVGQNVYVVFADAFGGYYLGGDFTLINGIQRNRLAYINSIGKLSDWNPNVNGNVLAIGMIGSNVYVGGTFTSVGNQNVSNFAVITRFGQIVNRNINVNGTVRSISTLGSNIYFGGNFTRVFSPTFAADNVTVSSWNSRIRFGLAAINTQGILLNWRIGLLSNNTANVSVVKTTTGNVYVGGNFTDATYPVSSLNNINKNGTVSNYIPEVSGNIYCITADNIGGYYIGGDFYYVDNQLRNSIAYINSSGSITPWNPQINGRVYSISVYNDNIYIGGQFTSNITSGINNIMAINTSGELLDWNFSTNNPVYSIKRKDNVFYIAGAFTTLGQSQRNFAAAVDVDGVILPWSANINNTVVSLYLDGDNIYIGGFFSSVNQNNRNYTAILNTSGDLLDWNPNINGIVYSINKYGSNIYIGGNFSYNQPSDRSSIYTTNSSGNLIGPNYGVGQNVNIIKYDSLGGFYIGGSFTSINGVERNRLAYINSSGELSDWNPSAAANVHSILIYGEGSTPNIYVGGEFTSVSSQTRNHLAAFNTSGSLLNWNPQVGGTVYSMYGFDNVIYIGGNYNVLGSPQSTYIKLLSDGSDIIGKYEIKDKILCMVVDPSGGVYIGGDFTSISGQARTRLAHINSSGFLTNWNPSVNSSVRAISILGSNIYFGGNFTSVNGNTRNRIAAVNTLGNLLDWNPNVSGSENAYAGGNGPNVHTIITSGQNIYFGGNFTSVNTVTRKHLAVVNTSGNILDWNPNPSQSVHALSILGNNIYIGGVFDNIVGSTREKFAVVNTDGFLQSVILNISKPSIFGDIGIIKSIRNIGVNTYIGGYFNTINGATTRNNLVGVNSNGDLLAWNPNVNDTVHSLSVFGSNIYFAGEFTLVSNNARNYIAAVDTSGSVLPWNPNLSGNATAVVAYQDGATPNFHVGGEFNFANSKRRNYIGSVDLSGNLLPWNPNANNQVFAVNGSGNNIFIGGAFTSILSTDRGRIAGVNSSGSLLSFNPSPDGNVRAISIKDNVVYFGGDFVILFNNSVFDWDYRRYAAAAVSSSVYQITSWNPNLDATVRSIEIDSSATPSIYLAGDFINAGQQKRKYAAAYDTDGNLLAWNPSANANVRTISIYGDNISIGGDFYDINSIIRPYIIAVDESATPIDWNPVVDNTVRQIYIYGSGATPNIYIAGDFTSVNGYDQKYIAAIDIDNNILNWRPNVNNTVHTVDVSGDNIYFGGSFDYLYQRTLINLGAINTDGFLTNLDVSPNDIVRDIDIVGSNIYFGGNFTGLKGSTTSISAISVSTKEIQKPYISINGNIQRILPDGNGGVYIGGLFSSVNGIIRNNLVQVDQNGTVTSWNPNVNGIIYDISMNNTDVYIAGEFTVVSGQPRYRIAGISKTGKLLDWNPPVDPFVWEDTAYQEEKKVTGIWVNNENIFITGEFGTVSGELRYNIAKLNTNGNLLSWYNNLQLGSAGRDIVEVNGKVYILTYDTGGLFGLSGFFVLDSDTGDVISTRLEGALSFLLSAGMQTLDVQGNNVIMAGQFSSSFGSGVASVNGLTDNWIVLSEFQPHAIAVNGDNIYVGGGFDKIGGLWTSAYVFDKSGNDLTNFFVRDNTLVDGNSIVYDYAFDQNGGVYIAGEFSNVSLDEGYGINGSSNYQTRNRLAYINSLGKFTSWSPNVNGTVYTIEVVGNNVYIGGLFSSVNGTVRNGFAAISSSGTLLSTEVETILGPSANIYSIESSGDNIYIAGAYTESASSYRVLNSNGNSVIGTASVGSNVFAIAVDSTGGAYIGGNFTTVNGNTRNRLAYIDSSGKLSDWNPNVNGNVWSIIVDGSGATPNIYIAGEFTTAGGNNRNRLAYINSSGLATTWNPNANAAAYSMVISGTNVYVGGNFGLVNGNTRGKLAAITTANVNATGNVESWNPSASSNIFAMAISGSDIYIGGSFTSVNGTGNVRSRLAAISITSNTLSATWVPSASNSVRAIAISGDNIYVGGDFTLIDGNTRNKLALINTNGNLQSWNPNVNASGNVYTIAVSGSTIYVGGNIANVSATVRNYTAAISADGTLLSWNPNANANVRAIVAFGDNIYLGGDFTKLTGATNPRNRLMAINTAGNVLSWNPNVNNSVNTIMVLGSNIYIGGSFTLVNGNTRNRVAAVDTSGDVIAGWNPSANSNVFAIAAYGTNIYLGGQFTTLNVSGVTSNRNYLAAVSTDGTLLSWSPNANASVLSLAIDNDNIYIGGNFTRVNSILRPYLAAVNTSGSLLDWTHGDTDSIEKRPVYTIAISGNNIYIGGEQSWIQYQFNTKLAIINSSGYLLNWQYGDILPSIGAMAVDGDKLYIGSTNPSNQISVSETVRNRIAAINTSGNTLIWNPNANGNVWSISSINENIYFGGEFTLVNGSSTGSRFAGYSASGNQLSILTMQLNGPVYSTAIQGNTLLMGGSFTDHNVQNRLNLVAINTSGKILSWNPSANNTVSAMTSLGINIYISGTFRSLGGEQKYSRGAVNTSGNVITWGSKPEVSGIRDLITYNNNTIIGVGEIVDNFGYYRNRYSSYSFVGVNSNTDSVLNTAYISDNQIYCFVRDNNGGFYIGGNFTSFGRVTTPHAVVSTSGSILDPIYKLAAQNFIGYIHSILPDAFGGYYIGGVFTEIEGKSRYNLAYINSSGGLGSWNPSANSNVYTLVSSGDNIYIGGNFTSIGGQTRNRLAAVNTSGALLDWNPSANDVVNTIAISGSNIYIGGAFTSINNNVRRYLAAVDFDANLLSWNPSASGSIYAILINGTDIYYAGSFINVSSTARNYIAASNTSGSLLSWNPSASTTVYSLGISGDNIYVAGNFTFIKSTSRNRLAAFNTSNVNPTGSILAWNPNANGSVRTMTILGDNIYIGGLFTNVSSTLRNYSAAISKSGTLLTWNPNVNSETLAIQSFGSNIYIGGTFTLIDIKGRSRLAHINSSGFLTDWNFNVNSNVFTMILSGDNIYFGGSFTSVNGNVRNRLGAVTTSGTLITTWSPNADANVNKMVLVNDNIYIGGHFTTINGNTRNRIAAVSRSGTLLSFGSEIFPTLPSQYYVNALTTHETTIYVGGYFYAATNTNAKYSFITNLGGSIITSNYMTDTPTQYFRPQINAALPDGSGGFYIGGDFTSISNQTRYYLAHINSSGGLGSWNPSADNEVSAMTMVGNNIYVGGYFNSVNENVRNYLAAINTSGNVLSWNPNADYEVYAMAASGTNIYVGGYFNLINNKSHGRIAIINTNGSTFKVDYDISLYSSGYDIDQYVNAIDIIGENIYFGGNFIDLGKYSPVHIVDNSLNSIYINNLEFLGDDFGTVSGWEYDIKVFAAKRDQFGGVYIGGLFSSINGQSRGNLAYINSSGGLGSWAPSANGNVFSIEIVGSNIYIGGAFTSVNGNIRNRLAAVNTSGNVLDWNPNCNGNIRTMTTSGTNIYIGGQFSLIKENSRSCFAVVSTTDIVQTLNADATFSGAVSTAFINAIAISGDNIYIGGRFTTIRGNARNHLAAINTNGDLLSWSANVSGRVYTLATSGNNVYIGGYFNLINGNARNNLAAVDIFGNLLSWNPSASSEVSHMTILGDNIYIGGYFDTISGQAYQYAAAINTAGSLLNWNPNPSKYVFGIIPTNEQIYLFGELSSLESTRIKRNYIAAFNTSGNIISWNPSASAYVYTMDSSGTNIYIGGLFTSINGNVRNRLAAVNTSGSVLSWDPSANGSVQSLSVNGQNIYIAGGFTSIKNTSKSYLAAVNTAGSIISWNLQQVDATGRFIYSTSSKILVSGDFIGFKSDIYYTLLSADMVSGEVQLKKYSVLSGTTIGRIDSLVTFSDNIYIGGQFTKFNEVGRNHIAVISKDGKVLDWGPNISQSVTAISVVGDNVYVGGNFTRIDNNVSASRLAIINTSGNVLDFSPKPVSAPTQIAVDEESVYISGHTYLERDTIGRIVMFNLDGTINYSKSISPISGQYGIKIKEYENKLYILAKINTYSHSIIAMDSFGTQSQISIPMNQEISNTTRVSAVHDMKIFNNKIYVAGKYETDTIPNGLSLNKNTGLIFGTPSTIVGSATHKVIISAKNELGSTYATISI